jgi:molybdate transport system permease protein
MDAATAFPIELSVRIALTSVLLVTPVGVVIAHHLVRSKSPRRWVLEGLVMLPLVLPPTVVGFLLVLLLGRRGVVGVWLEEVLAVRLTFTPLAAIIASAVVALPIVVKTSQAALESVPEELSSVARVLGLHPIEVFFRVVVPASWRGLLAATVLAFARALGEFGATLMFAGNIPGQTNTMPLEIFAAYQSGDDSRAMVYVLILCAMSTTVVWFGTRLSARRQLT